MQCKRPECVWNRLNQYTVCMRRWYFQSKCCQLVFQFFSFIFGSILRSAQCCLSDCLFSYLIYVECESSRLKLNIEITNKQIVSTINHHRSLPTHVRRAHMKFYIVITTESNRLLWILQCENCIRNYYYFLRLYPMHTRARSNGLLTIPIREWVDCTTRRNTQPNTHRTEKWAKIIKKMKWAQQTHTRTRTRGRNSYRISIAKVFTVLCI